MHLVVVMLQKPSLDSLHILCTLTSFALFAPFVPFMPFVLFILFETWSQWWFKEQRLSFWTGLCHIQGQSSIKPYPRTGLQILSKGWVAPCLRVWPTECKIQGWVQRAKRLDTMGMKGVKAEHEWCTGWAQST